MHKRIQDNEANRSKDAMKPSKTLIVLDLETTGTWKEKDKIVEIGMIKCFPDNRRETYVKRINPGILIPAYVSEIIGITNDDVKDAPSFKDVAQEVLSFIADADFGGFNIERFDLKVLEREFSDAGLKFEMENRKIYDAQKIYHLHERRDLSAAYKFYCNKKLNNAHSALADSEAALGILYAQAKKYAKAGASIEALSEFDYEKSSEFFDGEGKFRWWDGKLYPTFGKHAAKLNINEIVLKDPEYLRWMQTKDFSEEVLRMVKDALLGHFPEYPKPGNKRKV
ncbi:MAG: exonuclease domain-containing protein [Candidatus Omnitrophota bacterium]